MEKGTYALVIALEREAIIAIGKLGEFTFPAGYYIYLGSALGGLYTRVGRHLKREKRFHWHIDYLVHLAEVVAVWYALEGDERSWRGQKQKLECLWCQVACSMPQGQILIPGFGSSDCHCPAHLIYFPQPPSFELFRRMLEKRGYWVQMASPLDFKRRTGA